MTAARLVTARNGQVRTGIDVLEAHDFRELREAGKAITRLALVTNQTGVDAHGNRTIDVLAKARGMRTGGDLQPGARRDGKPGHHGNWEFEGRGHRGSGVQRLWRQRARSGIRRWRF